MRRALSVVLAAPLLLAAGCASTELRYTPPAPAGSFSPAGLAPVSALTFKDSSGGLNSVGTGLVLKRPFFDSFRDAVAAQFAALKVPVTPGAGSAVEVELTRAGLARGRGFAADVKASLVYALNVRSAGETLCRQEISGWATLHEGGLTTSTASEVLEKALTKAMENLAPGLSASCLSVPRPSAAGAAPVVSASRNPNSWALIVGVGGPAALEEARAAAEYAKNVLGVPGDHAVVVVDNMATLAAVQKYVERWLPDHAGPDHTVFAAFFVPGAGASLLPFDGDAAYPAETEYPLTRLYAVLGRLTARSAVVLGPDVPMDKAPRAPDNVKVISAGRDPRAALAAVKGAWEGR